MTVQKNTMRWVEIGLVICVLIVTPAILIDSAIHARVLSIAGVCLYLWIREVVPPFVPTLLLWVLIPLSIGSIDREYSISRVLTWAADPVMALFFGGFVLGVAAKATGIDRRLTGFALRSAGNSYRKFLLLVILLTAFLSMWMSNIAAAALVLACLHTVLTGLDSDDILRRMTLIGVALGADFGGIATPIGTGPNAIAIASISNIQPVSFLGWMIFALPLTLGMLTVSFLFLVWRVQGNDTNWKNNVPALNIPQSGQHSIAIEERRNPMSFLVIVTLTIILWLTEPLHGVPAAVVALACAFFVFFFGILEKKDLRQIDWSTLLLIAGGITLGKLLQDSGLVRSVAAQIAFSDINPTLSLFVLCLSTAVLSALMSNTATAVLVVPLALAIIPSPSIAILIAVSASFGVPLLISTPPNAMVFGQGGVKFGDLFWPGIFLMVVGCLVVSLTGRVVLNLAGIP